MPVKSWKVWAVVVLVGAGAYFIAFHTDRFLADFWPLDASRVAPNVLAALVQWTILGFLAYLVYPPFHRAVERYTQRHVDDLKAHVTAEHAKLHERIDHTHARLDALHNRLDGLEEPPIIAPDVAPAGTKRKTQKKT